MEKQYFLAVDIGASNGRHILASIENGTIKLEEIHRFQNGMISKNGTLCWDVERLYQEIIIGMKKCGERGKIPASMGIDTWAVDYVLLDRDNQLVGDTAGYRDSRTKGMDGIVYDSIAEDKLYERTGIQKQIFNTIYQLMAVKENHPEVLAKAETMLLIPDYFNYLLTGKKAVEYTNATTTQLVSPDTLDWDYELLNKLGYPKKIFTQIAEPGTLLGELKEEVKTKVCFNCKVILPATHDTGSAVIAVPSNEEHALYISSGTWSLMGVELAEANCSEESKKRNFTNEGGYQYRFRYLKNIMGLWMIQSVKKEIGHNIGFPEICEMASKESITSLVDCNDKRFLVPENMTAEVQAYCRETKQAVPNTLGEIACVIYRSLAKCYADTAAQIEKITGKIYSGIHVVGGGANVSYLNQLTADYSGKKVLAGPTEATAIGNVAVQMIAAGELKDLKDARQVIFKSFEIKEYLPKTI